MQLFIISLTNPSNPTSNCEELVIQGPESKQDLRVVNSYPSKVTKPNTPSHTHSLSSLHQRSQTGFQFGGIVRVDVKHLRHPVHGRKRPHHTNV